LNTLLTSDPSDKVDQVLSIFKACKVDEWAEALKQKYMQEALAHLEAIAVVEARKKPLVDLANYLMNRIQ
jgi:geranylgeranyl diphosphate synthase type II